MVSENIKARSSRRAAAQGICWCALIGWVLAGLLVGAGLSYTGSDSRLRIVYTNDTANSLLPCGCYSGQPGGLPRLATAVHQLAKERPVLAVDSGNLTSDPDRAAVFLRVLADLGFAGIGLGKLEVELGPKFVRLAAQNDLPVLSCVPEGDSTWEGVRPSVLREVEGVRVGVVGVGPALGMEEPEAAWEKVQPILAQVRTQSQIVVLLSQLPLATNRRLAELQGTDHLIDLVIGGRDAVSLKEPLLIGQTYLLPAVESGRQVGVVEVTFGEDGQPAFACCRLLLDDSFPRDEKVQALINAYYAGEARRLMERSATVTDNPSAQKYAAVEKCTECHRPQDEQWQAQKHAHAVETLRQADRLVPECLPCHSEQYRRTHLFKPVGAGASASPWPRDGVTCTTCHGDGVVHSLLGRKQLVIRDGGEALCRQCHDAERDPQFDYAKAKEAVRHW